jgi:ArsR family transcriptional regulator
VRSHIDVDLYVIHQIDACQYNATRHILGDVETDVIEACCAPVLAETLSADEAEQLAAAFKVLADPVRLRLLSMIASSSDGEMCACDLVEPLDRSQPTISHHLSVLAAAGLLTRQQRGKWAWFSVVPDRVAVLREALAVP